MILLQRFLGDEQGEQFALGDLKCGKRIHLLGVVIAVPLGVIFERQLQPVPHELEVTVDGFRADFEFDCERGGVGITARLNGLMDPQHPLQWRTRARRAP